MKTRDKNVNFAPLFYNSLENRHIIFLEFEVLRMLKFKLFVAIILCFAVHVKIFAATGCRYGSTDYLFSNYTGTLKLGYRIYERTPELSFSSKFCQFDTGTLCAIRTLDAAECAGCYHEDGDPYYYGTGTEYTYYDTMSCPIDDYVPFLLVFFAIGGFLSIRKMNSVF